MFTLQATKKFLRKYTKLIKLNPEIEERFNTVFDTLAENPTDSRRGSHKVIAVDGSKVFSSRVTGDIRIVWRYVETKDGEKELQIISLIDVGGHEGGKKVYR